MFDVAASLLILIVTSPFFLLLALAIKLDSRGPVFYRQVRVGRYDKDFRIFKFRTMVQNADKIGLSLTVGDDPRITRVGRFIRKCRLDEFSQLLNVLSGSMSLVGPRPEVRRYVDAYRPEYMATLLVRPGITAPSSIAFKDEDRLLDEDEMITWPDNNPEDWFYADMQEATNSHEYQMKKDAQGNEYEVWTKILPIRDWEALEKEWSDANSSENPGDVV